VVVCGLKLRVGTLWIALDLHLVVSLSVQILTAKQFQHSAVLLFFISKMLVATVTRHNFMLGSYIYLLFWDLCQLLCVGVSGDEEQWRYCASDTDGVLGFAVGAMFVRETFHGDSKPSVGLQFNLTCLYIAACHARLYTAIHDMTSIQWLASTACINETRRCCFVFSLADSRALYEPMCWCWQSSIIL
jgi:hypothetical protein